ncbi:MAG: peptidylprolyl isomerase [Candidatus Sumerlaeia bacterium]|nr:peptidylprolyl isomerase [Candidatus Sumerlaeia bacterium]
MLTILFGLGQVGAADSPAPDPETVHATVGEFVVSEADIDRRVAQEIARRGNIPADRQETFAQYMRQRFARTLVDEACLLEYARARDLLPSDEEVAARLEAEIEEAGGRDTWSEQLAAQQRTPEDAGATARHRLALERVRASVPTPPDEEIAAYFERNRERFVEAESVTASHILIGVGSQDSAERRTEKRALAESLRQRLLAGEEIAALAREHSTCPSKSKGGSLGSFGRGQMVGPFEEAAFALRPGQISPVVETGFGYHVIQSFDYRSGQPPTLENTRDRIVTLLRSQAIERLLRDIRESCDVQRP